MKAIVFALLAGLCWGVGELFTKAVLHAHTPDGRAQVGPFTALAVRAAVALPIILAVAGISLFLTKSEPREWLRADPAVLWKLVLGSGVVAGAGGVLFFFLALKFGELSRVKPIAFTVAPAMAVLLGWLVLHETMTWRKGIAVALILTGVGLLAGGRPTPAQAQTPPTSP